MKQVNIAEIKNRFSDYLKEVESGAEVGICRRNILVAKLTAAHETSAKSNRTKLGCGRGTVKIAADLTESMIPEKNWNMFGECK